MFVRVKKIGAYEYLYLVKNARLRIPAIAITCSDASRLGIPIDREQCGVGA